MQAMVYTHYGPPDVLSFQTVAKPAPRDNEVLVKVQAVSVNAYDWHLLTADIFLVRLTQGLFKPRQPILGIDIAGTVAAVGAGVTGFRPGDAVFGDISQAGSGGFAEYACTPAKRLAHMPATLSFTEAAAVPMAAVTALQGLRDHGRVQPGQHVLINGASGGVGTFAVQLAKAFGAEVTAVCSTPNLELVRSLGADHVVDYTREDALANGRQYDLILAVNGSHTPAYYRRALMRPDGTLVVIGGSMTQIFQTLLLGPILSRGGQTLKTFTAGPNAQDLTTVAGLITEGKVRPIIDRQYPFAEGIEAVRYLGEGHARGKVVITLA